MCDNLFVPGTLYGLKPGTSISSLEHFMVFMKTFGFVFNLSGVTLFGGLYREDLT